VKSCDRSSTSRASDRKNCLPPPARSIIGTRGRRSRSERSATAPRRKGVVERPRGQRPHELRMLPTCCTSGESLGSRPLSSRPPPTLLELDACEPRTHDVFAPRHPCAIVVCHRGVPSWCANRSETDRNRFRPGEINFSLLKKRVAIAAAGATTERGLHAMNYYRSKVTLM
jgi:hypothetical protein